MSGRILSLGSVNVDVQVRVPRWPAPGETLLVDTFSMLGGGKAANVAYLARKLGVDATLLACVGDDELAARALDPLRAAGVELGWVREAPGTPTGVALIAVRERDADKAILLAGNANDAWSPAAAEDAVLAVRDAPDGSVLVVDLEAPVRVVVDTARAARACGVTVVLDPSPADRVSDELLATCDAAVPNAGEAAAITGVDVGDDAARAIEAGRALCGRGPRLAFVKLRNGGCAVVDRESARAEVVDAPEAKPVDRTGAGDAFAGAVAVALLEGADPVDAARFAAAAAAFAVGGWGSQASYPTRDDLPHLRHHAATV